MQEDEYWGKDINHRRLVLFLAVALAISGWFQYKDLRKKEFQKTYYEQRIKTINMVFDIVDSIDRSKNNKEKLDVSKRFWSVHYGYAMPYFNNELFSNLDPLARYINKCIQKFEASKEDERVNCIHSLSFYLPNFALAARRELSKGWNIDFEKISETHPWHEMDKYYQ